MKKLIDKSLILRDLKKEIKNIKENDLSGQYGLGMTFALEQVKDHIKRMPIESDSSMETMDKLLDAMKANQRKDPEGLYSAGEIISWLERQKNNL